MSFSQSNKSKSIPTKEFKQDDAFYIIKRNDRAADEHYNFDAINKMILNSRAYKDPHSRLIVEDDAIYFGRYLREIDAMFPKLRSILLSRRAGASVSGLDSLTETNLSGRHGYIRSNSDFAFEIAKKSIYEKQKILTGNASKFFSTFATKEKKQSEKKELKTDSFHSPNDYFLDLINKNSAIAIGELHQHKSPKKLLFDNMKEMKNAGLNTIFLEHLLDSQQEMLDDYIFSDMKEMPVFLKNYLISLDSGFGLTDAFPYNFTGLIVQAKKYQVRIIPIDTDASYDAIEEPKLQSSESQKDPIGRGMMMNYNAYLATQEYMKTKRDHDKCLYLIGSGHVKEEYYGCPGVQQLADCGTSVVVEDINDKNFQISDGHLHQAKPDWVICIQPDFSQEALQLQSRLKSEIERKEISKTRHAEFGDILTQFTNEAKNVSAIEKKEVDSEKKEKLKKQVKDIDVVISLLSQYINGEMDPNGFKEILNNMRQREEKRFPAKKGVLSSMFKSDIRSNYAKYLDNLIEKLSPPKPSNRPKFEKE